SRFVTALRCHQRCFPYYFSFSFFITLSAETVSRLAVLVRRSDSQREDLASAVAEHLSSTGRFMDEFGYLSVLVSVILGLAVAQILKGFRGLLLSRARARIYWPVIGWAALLLLICFQSWWAMFELRHYQ